MGTLSSEEPARNRNWADRTTVAFKLGRRRPLVTFDVNLKFPACPKAGETRGVKLHIGRRQPKTVERLAVGPDLYYLATIDEKIDGLEI